MQLAYVAGNAAPVVTAIRLKCELNRLVVKQEEVGKSGEFDNLSDDEVRARREEWRAHYNDATVSADLITRMRALPDRRRILVVAADYCLDSTNTIPYIARLTDAVPERLQLRVLDPTRGQPIMEAHRTPDGRAATPTIAILGGDGHFIAAWTERPAATQSWFLEQQKVTMQKPLHDQLEAWYASDAGRTTVAEIAALLSR